MTSAILHGLALLLIGATTLGASQTQVAHTAGLPASAGSAGGPAVEPVIPGYVIGPDDVLSIVFWREKDMSAEVVVRPDGKISLPLLNDLQAAGATPDQLRELLVKAASKFIEEPNVTVVVKQINSLKVFVTGNVARPGSHALTPNMTVLQLIAVAGGLVEFANSENILVVRVEPGKAQYLKFNYKEVIRQKNIQQNVLLRAGDTVVVP